MEFKASSAGRTYRDKGAPTAPLLEPAGTEPCLNHIEGAAASEGRPEF